MFNRSSLRYFFNNINSHASIKICSTRNKKSVSFQLFGCRFGLTSVLMLFFSRELVLRQLSGSNCFVALQFEVDKINWKLINLLQNFQAQLTSKGCAKKEKDERLIPK